MSHRLITGLGITLALLFGIVRANPVPKDTPKEADLWIGDRLQKTVETPDIDDVKTNLLEVLDLLAKRADVRFSINTRAFRRVDVTEPEALLVAATRPIPAMKAPLATVLREMISRIDTEDAPTFLIRGDRIEILPTSALFAEIYGTDVEFVPGIKMPLIHLKATDTPLRDLVQMISDQADVNILVDPRCGEKGKAGVTVKLVNTPADTAVEILADMAGLEMIPQRNILYITSSENAARIRKEQERRDQLRQGFPFPGGAVPNGPNFPGLPAPLK